MSQIQPFPKTGFLGCFSFIYENFILFFILGVYLSDMGFYESHRKLMHILLKTSESKATSVDTLNHLLKAKQEQSDRSHKILSKAETLNY